MFHRPMTGIILVLSLIFSPLCMAHSQQSQYLFVLSAKQGEIKHNQLVLQQVDSQVLWFTDHPIRQAGVMPIKVFIQYWQSDFKKDPPNAALVHSDMFYSHHGQQQPLAIEIKSPVFQHGQLSYHIKGLSEQLVNKSLHDVHVFIDSFPLNPDRLTPYPNFRFQ